MKHWFKVYLSGPITGLLLEDAIDWTNYAKDVLKHDNIIGYRPLRRTNFTGNALAVMSNQRNKECVGRDRYDVMSCDCMLVNVLDAKQASIGTITEIAWAYLLQKPIVLVMEDNSVNVHEHGFIQEMITHRTGDLDIGLEHVKSILLPD